MRSQVKVNHIIHKVDTQTFMSEFIHFVAANLQGDDITTQQFYDDVEDYLRGLDEVKSASLLGVDINDDWNFEIEVEVWFKSEKKPRLFNLVVDE